MVESHSHSAVDGATDAQRHPAAPPPSDCSPTHNAATAGTVWTQVACGAWLLAAVAGVSLASSLYTLLVAPRRVYADRVAALMLACCGVDAVSLLVGALLTSVLHAGRVLVVPAARRYLATSCAAWCVVLNVVCLLTGRLGWTDAELERRLGVAFHATAWCVSAALTVVDVLVRDDDALCGHVTDHVVLAVAPPLVCIALIVALRLLAVCVRRRPRRRGGDVVDERRTSDLRVWLVSVATLAGLSLSVVHQCIAAHITTTTSSSIKAAAAAAASVVYPPLVSVVSWAACVMCSRRPADVNASCSRMQACGEAPRTCQPRHQHARLTPHHHQQQQLMRHNITFSAALQRQQQRNAAAKQCCPTLERVV